MDDIFGNLYAEWHITDTVVVRINDTVVNIWKIGAFLILFAIIVRIALTRFTDKPKGFQNFVELIVESFSNFATENLGKKHEYLGVWFFGLFAFLLCSNFSGLIGFRPPSADIAMNVGLALVTFTMIHFYGIFTNTKEYFKGYLSPMFLFLPLNILGLAATPISLSFRLFGNILSGVIISQMIYSLLPIFFHVAIPSVLNVYFDVFSGALQAFIFTILSMVFVAGNFKEEEATV